MKLDLSTDYIVRTTRRFWAKVKVTKDDDSCWLWKASTIHSGHGNFSILGSTRTAHSVAWLLTYGDIPEGLEVLHNCDNGSCVRPSHLYVGTQSRNMMDRRDRNPPADQKLTHEQAAEIRLRYAAGDISQRALAREYGVTHTTIGSVVRNERWLK